MKIAILPGDGIGPEIRAATRLVLEAVDARFGFGFTYTEIDIGFAALERHGTTFPGSAFDSARTADGLILGPVSHLDYPRAKRAGSIRPANFESGLTSTPISAPRRRGKIFRRAPARSSTW